jgi:hypothetical protein
MEGVGNGELGIANGELGIANGELDDLDFYVAKVDRQNMLCPYLREAYFYLVEIKKGCPILAATSFLLFNFTFEIPTHLIPPVS